MLQNMKIWIAVATVAMLGMCQAQLQPSEAYLHFTELDDDSKVRLYWKFDDGNITFELHVDTTGWIGLGVSPSGFMRDADIHVGWVKNGQAKITDRHGPLDGNGFPNLDLKQNLELISGKECNGWTVLKFRRQLAGCENVHDVEITADTVKLIYAYGEDDPSGDDLSQEDYHNQARGSKSMLLLDPATTDESMFPDGEEHESFDLTNDRFALPAVDTYYNCRLHKLPEIKGKHHLVKIEPIIQPGNEAYLHHMLVFSCKDDVTSSESVGQNSECYTNNMPQDFNSCQFVMHAWATGAGDFHYPKNVGLPLGTEDAPRYVVVETHYDNPTIQGGVVDSSGLRFVYTSQLRQFDAGVMEIGHQITSYNHVIPPNTESFLDTAMCSAECLGSGMEQDNLSEINIFGVQLHSHLLAKQVTLRHIRNGVELAPIASDKSYNFNFQETRHLKQERVFTKEDSMQVVCNYKTKNVRLNITLGGFSSYEEMCESFVYYYPKMSMTYCFSAPPLETMLGYFGIDNFTDAAAAVGEYGSMKTVSVTKPDELAGKSAYEVLNMWPWDEENADHFAAMMTISHKAQYCGGTKGMPPGVSHIVPPLVINETFAPQPLKCAQPSDGFLTSRNIPPCSSPPPDVITTSGSSRHLFTALHLKCVVFAQLLCIAALQI